MGYIISDAFGHQTQIGLMLRIGSDPANEIVLQDAKVAPFHATLGEQPDGCLLRDEKSKSGTFVNQKRIKGLVSLIVGDQIAIGGTTFMIDNNPQAQPAPPTQIVQTAPTPITQVAPQPVAAAPAREKKSGGCGKWALTGILASMLACIILIGGGYLLYSSGMVTLDMVYTWIGMGPAQIHVNNLNDSNVFLSIKEVSEDANANVMQPIYWELAAFDTKAESNSSVTNKKFIAYFGTSKDGSELGTCTFTPKSGDKYSFVILPDKILVDKVEFPEFMDKAPSSGTDLVIETSSLCR